MAVPRRGAPVHALLAAVASVCFGQLCDASRHLAVPKLCHAAYDVAALLWAQWTVTGLSPREREEIWTSGPGAPREEATTGD